MKALTDLEAKFTPEKLRQHSFEWVQIDGMWTWLPRFRWWKPREGECPSLRDIWREYASGIGGLFSILELTEHWKARWKRNEESIKSEFTRRNKIYKLVSLLMERNGWTAEEALDFLDSRYPLSSKSPSKHLRSSRYFADWLNKSRYDEILKTSMSEQPVPSVDPGSAA
jgi:hypothetical protein